jgi:Caspase domain
MATVNGFRTSHAVVIGINAYGNGIPHLRTAVNDARGIGQVLEAGFGYTVHLLTEDVTLRKLKSLLDESLSKEVQSDDRVLIYFAGHGIALDGDDGPAGYLVPQDARPDDRQTFLPMTDLSAWLNRLPCRHLLLVLDCCFAGAFRWSSTRELGAVPEVIHKERFDRYIRDPAWQVITSAAYDQKALDVLSGAAIGQRAPYATNGEHSPFAAGVLRALQGEADLYPRAAPGRTGGDGVITATELYLYLRGCVEDEAEGDGHRQTPGLWPLKKHDKGEYIHLVPGHALNLPPAPELNEANNPYRGLQSYDEEHTAVFFGRTQFVGKLAERVAGQPLTIVLGASGTGKSSVVKAGLFAHLRETEPAAWQIRPPIRPGKSPLASLATLVMRGEDNDLGARLAEFWTDSESLATRVGAWAALEPAGRLLLVVDQFEELITLCWDAGERDRFIRLLERALAAHADRLRVVLTLRSDFEPQFAHSALEGDWMSSRIIVPAMTLDEYREVIEGPASAKVLYFQGRISSQEFINRLIGDVANTPGALPLLSFTLSELYRRYVERQGEDRALREDDYERLGGVGGSLRNRADQVYDGLSDDRSRETMRRVMLRMVSVQGGELARRRVPDQELVYEDSDENGRVEQVVAQLTEARLVVEGNEIDDQPFIEPAHDELIKGWDKLFRWSREESEKLQLLQRLTPAARAWESGQGGLWLRDPRLNLLKQLLRSDAGWLNRLETTFVRTSVSVRRWIIAAAATGLALSFAIISVLGLIAHDERGRAVSALAETEKTLAKSLLSVLGLSGESPVTAMEMESLWQLATLPSDNENVRLLFFIRALETGVTARQLRLRADQAVHAAVQLDESRRDRVANQIILPILKAPPKIGTALSAVTEIRVASALVGRQLGMLENDNITSREFARLSLEAALDSLHGTFNHHPDQISLLAQSAARLGPADAMAAISTFEKALVKKEAARENIWIFVKPAYKAAVSRLDATDRFELLKSMVTRVASNNSPLHFSHSQIIIAIAADGLQPEVAAELTQPFIDRIAPGRERERSGGNLPVLLAFAPYWDETTTKKAVIAVRLYTSAYVAETLERLRVHGGRGSATEGWEGATKFLKIAASDLPWNARSSDLKSAAITLIETFQRGPGMPFPDWYETSARGILAMARWMDPPDLSSLVQSIQSALAHGKFEAESGRTELAAVPAKLKGVPRSAADPSCEFPPAARTAWSQFFAEAPKALPARSQPSARQTPLSANYRKNTSTPTDPEAAARAIIEELKRPQFDGMFDLGPVISRAAILQHIGPELSETSRRETASVVLQALLARGVKGGTLSPRMGPFVEALIVSANLEGPDAMTQTLKQLLASGTELLGGYQVPGDRIMSQTMVAPAAIAGALLANDSVVVGERDLIDMLKYPSYSGDLRAALLARLGRAFGHPTPYKSVWAFLDDLRHKRPDLYDFARATVVRPRNPST